MAADPLPSQLRVEKRRVAAVLTLSNGEATTGCFFVAGGSARHAGPERVADVLNSEAGFFPFEVTGAAGTGTVLLHRDHVVMAALTENEASGEPGYSVATKRTASLSLSSGRRIVGTVRIHRPEGHDRLSDWAHNGERFRYIETAEATLLINVDHVLEVREVTQS